jgi:hypothetical protein
MRNINGGKGRKKNAATRKRKETPQTKQNAEENPKAGTLRQFVSATQKEGDQGVPTLQSKGREKRKATAAHSIGCHSSAPRRKRAIQVYQPKQKHRGKGRTAKRKKTSAQSSVSSALHKNRAK